MAMEDYWRLGRRVKSRQRTLQLRACQLDTRVMKQTDLSRDQSRKILESIRSRLGYLTRLRQGMERAGFSPDDSLFQAVIKAYEAFFDLSVKLHYLSCAGGVGMAPRAKGELPSISGNSATGDSIGP
jgi:hypothetical protein